MKMSEWMMYSFGEKVGNDRDFFLRDTKNLYEFHPDLNMGNDDIMRMLHHTEKSSFEELALKNIHL